MRIAVIGGGAAGFFAALSAKAHRPGAEVLILEKSNKLLAKVKVSGGGRCNVTHDCPEPKKLARHYPRGERFLRKAFDRWCVRETVAWFEQRGVPLKTEDDGRMFPVSDLSQSVIDCLVQEAMAVDVEIRKSSAVLSVLKVNGRFRLLLDGGGEEEVDRIVVASGGHPKAEGYAWLKVMGHSIIAPVPSLFTFNLERPMADLMGVTVPHATVRIEGTALEAAGPLLITHWGLSGPVVLRLSAWGARELNAMGYRYAVRVNWIGTKEEEARTLLNGIWSEHSKKMASNALPFEIPQRLWVSLMDRAGIDRGRECGSIGKHDRNRLIDLLVNDRHAALGKTTFKEEFVTAGGVHLGEVDPLTMASRIVPGLFFAGEVLDIDGITGGFNFQAAWTTGWIAGRSAVELPPGHMAP